MNISSLDLAKLYKDVTDAFGLSSALLLIAIALWILVFNKLDQGKTQKSKSQ